MDITACEARVSLLVQLDPMCELEAFFLNSENEPVKIYWLIDERGQVGRGLFFKNSECILHFAVEWSGDLSKFGAQVDTGEPLFKKPGMKQATK